MKIGIIGTGAIVEEFIKGTEAVEKVECTAVFSRKEETAKRLADKYHIKSIYTDYEMFLNVADINFVYIASPNSLHFKYAYQALQNGKNVICEKPFTTTIQECRTLIELAKEKKLFLFEAITTLHLPNYNLLKEHLTELGDIKSVQCNYSQYSSRYDKYLAGEITNIFSPEFSGGALMDINIYNLHFVTGLFGKAKEVKYFANIGANGIDTSGVAALKYDNFTCTCTGAKDSNSPGFAIIQGTKGYIRVDSPSSTCVTFEVALGNMVKTYNEQNYSNRLVYEIIEFSNIYQNDDFEKCHALLEHSLKVIETTILARKDAGIVFAADKE